VFIVKNDWSSHPTFSSSFVSIADFIAGLDGSSSRSGSGGVEIDDFTFFLLLG